MSAYPQKADQFSLLHRLSARCQVRTEHLQQANYSITSSARASSDGGSTKSSKRCSRKVADGAPNIFLIPHQLESIVPRLLARLLRSRVSMLSTMGSPDQVRPPREKSTPRTSSVAATTSRQPRTQMGPASRSPTIRELLTHTAGFSNNFINNTRLVDAYHEARATDGLDRPEVTTAEAMQRLALFRYRPGRAGNARSPLTCSGPSSEFARSVACVTTTG